MSTMARKLIIVPKDKQAEHDLDYDKASPEQLIEIRLTSDELYELDKAGVFDYMNEVSNAMIDDFESAEITIKEHLLQIFNSKIFDTPIHTEKLKQIRSLFQEALDRNTGVYFYF